MARPRKRGQAIRDKAGKTIFCSEKLSIPKRRGSASSLHSFPPAFLLLSFALQTQLHNSILNDGFTTHHQQYRKT
jgi:hypothetical protein